MFSLKEKKTTIEKFYGVVSMAGNAIMMNLLFLAACIPVVTIGQAWCGLMGAVRYNIRGEKWLAGFKKGFKTRFLRGTLAWCVGLFACLFFLWDLNAAIVTKDYVTMVASGLMFSVFAMLLHSSLALNVYIYTDVNNWLKNTVNLLFRAPLQLLGSAAMLWGPVVMVLLFPPNENLIAVILDLSLVFVCAYFALAAVVTTMALKGGLTSILIDCRADGLIIAEEGIAPDREDAEGDKA